MNTLSNYLQNISIYTQICAALRLGQRSFWLWWIPVDTETPKWSKGMSISPSPRLRGSWEEEAERMEEPEQRQTLCSGQGMSAVPLNSQQKWLSVQAKVTPLNTSSQPQRGWGGLTLPMGYKQLMTPGRGSHTPKWYRPGNCPPWRE